MGLIPQRGKTKTRTAWDRDASLSKNVLMAAKELVTWTGSTNPYNKPQVMEETTIPKTTISRLFQTVVFEHDDTRITDQTLELSAEYLRMFVRETVLRANEAREAGIEATRDGQPVDGVLDTAHLEEIAGLLVLDF